MGSSNLLDYEVMGSVSAQRFARAEPFPQHLFDGLLRPGGFRELMESFPDLELFEHHLDRPRKTGQRPHNRFYLAYDPDVSEDRPGVIGRGGLPIPWRGLLDELERGPYLSWAKGLLQAEDVGVRYAWHVGVEGSEVSPHRDSARKVGTHIFYFNTRADWDPVWGGQTLLLGGLRRQVPNPDFDDFEEILGGEFLDNKSLLFQRTAESWHGVQPLACPEHGRRKLFNVIFERPA